MSKVKGKSKRGWIIALAVTIVISVAGLLAYRSIGALRIIPVTQQQIDAISGNDLVWKQPPNTNTVSREDLIRLSKDPLVTEVTGFLTPPVSPGIHKGRIRESWRVTDKLLSLIADKSIEIPDSISRIDKVYSDFINRAGSTMGWQSTRRMLAKFLGAQIGLEVELKDGSRCLKACLNALKFDELQYRTPVTDEIDYLVRMAVDSIILAAIDKAVNAGVFNADQLEKLYDSIRPATENDSGLADCQLFEWSHLTTPFICLIRSTKDLRDLSRVSLSGLDDSEEGIDQSYLECGELDAPATLRMAAELTRAHIANCDRPWSAQDHAADRKLEVMTKKIPEAPNLKTDDNWFKQTWEKSKFRAKMAALPNSLGLSLLTIALPIDAGEPSFRDRTIREADRLTILIQLYKQLKKKLPAKLSDLEPLSGKRPFPRDLFSGGPFLYDPVRNIFWSVNKNGIDDGGVGGPSRFGGPDMVFALP